MAIRHSLENVNCISPFHTL